jgi:hypothetical protein
VKAVIKILKWVIISLVILIVLLAAASVIMQDRIVAIFINSVNKTLTTRIETSKVHFSLISRFPKASVRFENLLVHSSQKFDKTEFVNFPTDTLLFAKSAVCEFNVRDIIKSKYNIDDITINNGRINILSDSNGGINYDISTGKDSSPETNIEIRLDKITLSNTSVLFINKATSLLIRGNIKSSRIKSKISGNYIDLSTTSNLLLSRVEIFPVFLKTSTQASLDLNLHKSDSGFIFRKGALKIDNFAFNITGNITKDNNLNLKISGKNIDVSKLKKFLIPEYKSRFSDYDPSGILKIDIALSGIADRTHNPLTRLDFSLEKGHVAYRKSMIRLDDISFKGSFSNGRKRSPETSVLNISKFGARLGSASHSGSFRIENFIKPVINLSVEGKVFPSELAEFFKISELSGSSGNADVSLKLSGVLNIKDKFTMSDFLKLRPSADLKLNSVSLSLDSNRLRLKDINGKMKIGRNVIADSISFFDRDQYFLVSGDFINLPAWIAGQNVVLRVYGDITARDLRPEYYLKDSLPAGNSQSFSFPKGAELDLNFDISNLKYQRISAKNLKGRMLYRTGLLSFKSLNINSLDGNITGDCFLAQGENNTFISHGNFTLDDIDINKTFTSFNNFGQTFIKAENLTGRLSGKLTLLIPLDSRLEPVSKGVTAEGKYVITDGTLSNFEPIKSLSKFIELSELENIKFSKLENDFFIKDRSVVIPQMDIKSSAADFSVSGKHGFDNDYEYHIKTYLSVLLSKKAKKSKKSNEEFGAIEDDGLGRTSVFLKLTGKDENLKVAYDLKAAGGKLKQNLKSEKESLRTILNKEYGWYKKDSTIKQDTPATKPKFRIEWDDSDSTAIKTDTVVTKKDKGINSIFRKKKGER